MDKIRFRLAHADDAEKLLDVYAPYVENTNISFEYEVPTVEQFRQRIETISAKFPYIVALADDEIVGYAVEAVKEADGAMFICADHGNADQMIDYETGAPFTAHTTNPIPFILVNCPDVKDLKKGGRLCDIAPTLLDIMGLPQPEEMTGISLLER